MSFILNGQNIFKSIIGHPYTKLETDITTFIHSSDIHLGSYQYRCEERAKDFIQRFKDLLLMAIKHQVDFIILGGDVFTSLEILPGYLTEIIKILRNFQAYTQNSISIVTIEGNHDIRKFSRGFRFSTRGQSWLKLLASLNLIILLDADFNSTGKNIFKSHPNPKGKAGKIRIKNAMIYGGRYMGETVDSKYFKLISRGINSREGLFHILLQHFGIHGQMKNVPGVNYLALNPLKDKVHYLALGHYHVQYIIDNWIFNPGSLEAVSSLDHSFKRCVFLVKIYADNSFEVKSIKLKNRIFFWETLLIKRPIFKFSSLLNFILEHLNLRFSHYSKDSHIFGEKPLLYLTLKGQKPKINSKNDLRLLKNEILDQFNFIDVKIYEKYNERVILLNDFLCHK